MDWQQWMRRARISAVYRMKWLAQYFPLLPKETQNQPFIILGHPRSGSTLLHTLLNSHPRIYSRGEWLGLDYDQRLAKGDVQIDDYLQEGLRALRYPVKAMGFKFFYEYERQEWGRGAFQLLSEWPQLKVIHLKRQNLLQQYISLKIAKKTQKWSAISSASKLPAKERKIVIDANDLFRYLEALENWEATYLPLFQHSPILEVTYEELVNEQKRVLQEVVGFLELHNWPMTSPLLRQNPEPWETLVLNSEELREAVLASKWASLIEIATP